MGQVRFSVAPGVAAPIGAAVNPLTNIRHVVPPVGRVKAFLDQLSGVYSAIEQSRIAQTYFELADAGILDTLEMLCIRLRNLPDFKVNWSTSSSVPTINGGTFEEGKGIKLDGVDDYINANFKHGRYALGDASILAWPTAYASSTVFSPRLFGRIGNTAVQYAQLVMGSSTIDLRLNQSAGNVQLAAGPAFPPPMGLFVCTDTTTEADGVVTHLNNGYYQGVKVGSGALVNPAIHPVASGLAFGRAGSAFYPWTYQLFGYGGALTDEQVEILFDSVSRLFAAID